MVTRADNHDRDKLNRWHEDLKTASDDVPPVFAVFLVSGEDKIAHDIFRSFRTSFEKRDLGFAHLVIFGQHGVSATASRLRSRFGASLVEGPLLVLYSGSADEPEIEKLPGGEHPEPSLEAHSGWKDALGRAETAIVNGAKDSGATVRMLKELCADLASQG